MYSSTCINIFQSLPIHLKFIMFPCNYATVNIHGMFHRKYMTLCVLFLFQQLSESLDAFGYKWEINPGDGAFYGPKVSKILY